MPFPEIKLKATKPLRDDYPKSLKTLGDHIRKKRIESNLFQKDVAKIIGVGETTICSWENNKHIPVLRNIPNIIRFLGYNPFKEDYMTFIEKLVTYRKLLGLSRRMLAKKLGLHVDSVAQWETGICKPNKANMKKLNDLFNKHSLFFE